MTTGTSFSSKCVDRGAALDPLSPRAGARGRAVSERLVETRASTASAWVLSFREGGPPAASTQGPSTRPIPLGLEPSWMHVGSSGSDRRSWEHSPWAPPGSGLPQGWLAASGSPPQDQAPLVRFAGREGCLSQPPSYPLLSLKLSSDPRPLPAIDGDPWRGETLTHPCPVPDCVGAP